MRRQPSVTWAVPVTTELGSTPEGTSTDTTGTPAPLIASISAAASARGAPSKPVPKSASITRSQGPSTPPGSTTTVSRPSPCRISAATRPSPPFEPLPQTATTKCASG